MFTRNEEIKALTGNWARLILRSAELEINNTSPRMLTTFKRGPQNAFSDVELQADPIIRHVTGSNHGNCGV